MKHTYISNWQYNQADEEELEQIEEMIQDFYQIATEDLGLKNIKEINRAIRNLLSENYVNDSVSLQIFKIADQGITNGAMGAHMQCYEKIKKIALVSV